MPVWGYAILGVILMVIAFAGIMIVRASGWLPPVDKGEDDRDRPRSAFFD